VAAWGDNSVGQTSVPAGLTSVVAIAAGGNHSLALKSDGTVAAWGDNSQGQTTLPAGLTGVVAIAAGTYHSLALKSDGTVATWGDNSQGQATVPTGLNGVVAIAAGYNHSLALKSNGTVAAWGWNGYGQTTDQGLTGVVAIAAGTYYSLALKSNGTVVAWGRNNAGQTDVPASLTGVVAIAAGWDHSLALKSDGTVVAWGDNTYGQTSGAAGLTGVVAIAAGTYHSLALKSNGTVVAWGRNNAGQTTVPAGLSTPVKGKSIAAGGNHSLVLKSDGTVAAWGYNLYGQTTVPSSLTGIVAIAAGFNHSLALKSDGTVAAWGYNSHGQTDVPASLTGVVAIAAGWDHSLALKSDGTVVAWGDNIDGQTTVPVGLTGVVAIAAGTHSLALKSDGTVVAWGNNNLGQTDVPLGLSGVVAIFAGYYHSFALKSDGTIAAWGYNINGQTTVPASLTGVVAFAAGDHHSIALKSDGTVVAWGNNVNGESTVPVGLTGVVAIAAGGAYSLALKSDGTVVAWGGNSYGKTTVPGNANLNGLTVDAGSLIPTFDSSVTSYTYSYVGSSAASVNVTATLADSANASLMFNNQVQASGVTAAVYLTGATTVIPVRVSPFFLPDQTYSVTVVKDSTAPNVTFGTNGNTAAANTASTTVTVSDTESGVDAVTLQYAWTTSAAVPTSGWTPFASGDALTKTGANVDWYLHIQAMDNVGNTANVVSNRFRIAVAPTVSSVPTALTAPIAPTAAVPSEPGITVNPDGGITLHIDPANIVKETRPDGTVVEKLVLSELTMNNVLEQLQNTTKHLVIIEINDTEQVVQVQFPAASIAAAFKSFPDAVFEVKLNGVSFQLRVSVLDLDDLAKRLGVTQKDLKVNIVMERVNDQVKNDIEQLGVSQGFKVYGNVVDFKLTAEASGQTVEIRDFGGTYMARVIVVDGDAVNRNLMAVHYDAATKTVSFIPSVHAVRADGKQEVVLMSPHNSMYAVIDASGKTFADLRGHWSKADVELLASKLIVNGLTDNLFAPDADITRAEFAALLVRALGVSTDLSATQSGFVDVAADAWYAPAVQAASNAGLVSGMAPDRFAPNERITREQMAVMVSRAITLAGQQAEAAASQGKPAGQADQLLAKFADQTSISTWAQAAVAQTAGAGIIMGMDNGIFAPSEYATRAQAAVMLRRFLQYVRFID
ncbi:MAG: hypothetical protein JWM44_281, partial [Bacilli bacterium]|nr:hypothetical protein [Bacilli bacterium]